MKFLKVMLPLLLIAALLLVGCTTAKNPGNEQDSTAPSGDTGEDTTTASATPTEQDAIEAANEMFRTSLDKSDSDNLADPVCELNEAGTAWVITRALKDGSKSWACTVQCSNLSVIGFGSVQEDDEP